MSDIELFCYIRRTFRIIFVHFLMDQRISQKYLLMRNQENIMINSFENTFVPFFVKEFLEKEHQNTLIDILLFIFISFRIIIANLLHLCSFIKNERRTLFSNLPRSIIVTKGNTSRLFTFFIYVFMSLFCLIVKSKYYVFVEEV